MLSVASLFTLLTLSVTLIVEEPSEDVGGGEEGEVEVRPRAEDDVVRSCETALGPGECSAPTSSEPDPTKWFAKVVFSPISVDVTLEKAGTRIHRQLVFSEADGLEQRRRAAGLLVAAMIASARLLEQPQDTPPSAGTPPSPPAPPAATKKPTVDSPEVPGLRLSIDVALSTAPLLDWDSWGLGGTFSGTWWTAPSSRLAPWGLTASFRGMHSVQTPTRTGQLEGSLGVAVSILDPKRDWSLQLRGAALLSATRVFSVPDTEGSQGALRGGAQFGAAVAFGRSHYAPYFGVDGRWLAPELEIQRSGVAYVVVPPLSVVLNLGVRFQHLEIN